MSWTAANGNGSVLTGYVVRAVSGPNLGQTVATSGAVTGVTLGSLGGGSAAAFSVAAVSACGTGAATTTAAVSPSGAASTFVTAVHADNPAVEYRLSDPNGRIMADSSGHALDGRYGGQQTLGRSGALPGDPDTSSACVNACTRIGSGSPTLPRGNSPRTIEAWIQTTSATPAQTVFAYGASGTDQGFSLTISPESVNVNASADAQSVATPRPLTDGSWHLITVSYDGSAFVAYVDGQPVGSARLAGVLNTLSGPATVGSSPFLDSSWSGQLQEVAVYPVALSAAQVAAHFTASGYGRPGAPGAPAAVAGANRATVSWTAAVAPNSPVTGYLVTASAGGVKANAVAVPASAGSVVVGGLSGGTAYTFTVQGIDAFGYGTAATTAAITATGAASTYASSVLASKPSVFLRLGDSTPAVMADSSGHGQHGFYNPANSQFGVAGAIAGDPGTAVSDQGTGLGYGSVSALSSIPLGNAPRSVELWVRQPATISANQPLVSWGQLGPDQLFEVLEVSPTQLEVSGFGDDQFFSLAAPLDDNAWHLVSVTYNGTTVVVYVDGQQVGSGHFNAALSTLAGPLELGSDQVLNAGLAASSLDDLAVFPVALSATQVAAHFAASGYSRPTAPKVLHAGYGGANAAQLTWGYATAANAAVLGYQATVLSGPNKGESITTPETGTLLTGLAAGQTTFQVRAFDAYGFGPWSTIAAYNVPGASSTYASSVLASAPSVFLRLGDSTAAVMADSSVHGQNGFYNPSNSRFDVAGAIAGDPGTAVSDQGTADGYASVSALTSIPLGNAARSVEVWVRQPPTLNADQALLSWGQPGPGQLFDVVEASPTRLEVSGFADDHFFVLAAPLDDNAWHLVSATYTGSTLVVYVDGQRVGSGHFNAALGTLPGPLELGSDQGLNNGLSASSLDDLAVYPVALSAAQVAAHFTAAGHSAVSPPNTAASRLNHHAARSTTHIRAATQRWTSHPELTAAPQLPARTQRAP